MRKSFPELKPRLDSDFEKLKEVGRVIRDLRYDLDNIRGGMLFLKGGLIEASDCELLFPTTTPIVLKGSNKMSFEPPQDLSLSGQ